MRRFRLFGGIVPPPTLPELRGGRSAAESSDFDGPSWPRPRRAVCRGHTRRLLSGSRGAHRGAATDAGHDGCGESNGHAGVRAAGDGGFAAYDHREARHGGVSHGERHRRALPALGCVARVRWIDIAFCVGCNYQPRAAALAATLREAYPETTVTLTPTGGGRFELSVDGKLLFSKLELGRHLVPGEALLLLSEQPRQRPQIPSQS
ncbi:MAG: hypothetical protein C0503_03925 [Gemmatimonas sp.]|nr:hypothetical protein [Gemmatimonas sp.]